MNRKVIIVAVMLGLLIACGGPRRIPTGEEASRCPLPKEDLRESDLNGTWRAVNEAAVSSDVIILREDGTYQQIYERLDGTRYQSQWNRWWIEQRRSGGVYVHLEGMRYCDSTTEECERLEGGGGDWVYYDVCEDRALQMPEEVVLAVISTEGTRNPLLENAPREISLMHMSADPDTSGSFFVLED